MFFLDTAMSLCKSNSNMQYAKALTKEKIPACFTSVKNVSDDRSTLIDQDGGVYNHSHPNHCTFI